MGLPEKGFCSFIGRPNDDFHNELVALQEEISAMDEQVKKVIREGRKWLILVEIK